jgi:hypothetical protein
VRYLRSAAAPLMSSDEPRIASLILPHQVRYLRSAKLTIIVKSNDGTPSQVSAADGLSDHLLGRCFLPSSLDCL